jgi:osmotically-inducible protein OsmY
MAELEALAEAIEDGVVEFVSDGHGTVKVEGWVASFGGHIRALEIATCAPGVRSVDDRLEILLARA